MSYENLIQEQQLALLLDFTYKNALKRMLVRPI